MTKRAEWIVVIAIVASVVLLQARDWYAALAVGVCGLLLVREGLGMMRGARGRLGDDASADPVVLRVV